MTESLDALWTKLADKKDRLDAVRLRDEGAAAAVDRRLDLEFNYASNALEGNTLTRDEVAAVVAHETTIGGKALRDHNEVVDHRDALIFARAFAAGDEPIREEHIRHLHALILRRSAPETAGRYSDAPRAVSGSLSAFAEPYEIAPMMADFVAGLPVAAADPLAAVEAHYDLVSIHPFADGNGRTARLLMNLLLLRAGYPLLVVAPEQAAAYVSVLEARQLGGPDEPYCAFMAARLEESLDLYLTD